MVSLSKNLILITIQIVRIYFILNEFKLSKKNISKNCKTFYINSLY